MNNSIVALLDSWQETDFILYKASFLGLTENDMSILTPKTPSANSSLTPTSPGARYLGITAGAPLKVADMDFTAYGDWAVLPLPPGKQSSFDGLTSALKKHGVGSATAARLIHGLKKGSTMLFIASCTKDMVEKMKTLLKDAFILDTSGPFMLEQIDNFRKQGCL